MEDLRSDNRGQMPQESAHDQDKGIPIGADMNGEIAKFGAVQWSCRIQCIGEIVAKRGGNVGGEQQREIWKRGADDEKFVERRVWEAFQILVKKRRIRNRDIRQLGAWEAFCMSMGTDLDRLNSLRFMKSPSELAPVGSPVAWDDGVFEGPLPSFEELMATHDALLPEAWEVAKRLDDGEESRK